MSTISGESGSHLYETRCATHSASVLGADWLTGTPTGMRMGKCSVNTTAASLDFRQRLWQCIKKTKAKYLNNYLTSPGLRSVKAQ